MRKIILLFFVSVFAMLSLVACGGPVPTAAPIVTTPEEFSFRAGAADMCLLMPKSATDDTPLHNAADCTNLVGAFASNDAYGKYSKAVGLQPVEEVFYSAALNFCTQQGIAKNVCDDLVSQMRKFGRFEMFKAELFAKFGTPVPFTPTPSGIQG